MALAAAFWALGRWSAAQPADEQCLECHADPRITSLSAQERAAWLRLAEGEAPAERSAKQAQKLLVQAEALKGSAHGGMACADCHLGLEALPHGLPVETAACETCHPQPAKEIEAGPHRRGAVKGRPSPWCLTCHGAPHEIPPPGQPLNAQQRLAAVERCSPCHRELAATYRASFHGKAAWLGHGSAAVCSDCHGGHDILPNSDPRSRIAAGSLQTTCGQCHGNVNANFVKFVVHADWRDRQSNPPIFYTWLGMNILLLSVLGVFIPHSLLWLQRSLLALLFGRRRGRAAPPGAERMIQRFRPVHRLTHALIVVSFMGLAATGFPLKYCAAPWAQGLASALGGLRTIRLLHRSFAVMTLVYAAIHLGFLARWFAQRRRAPRKALGSDPDSLAISWRDLRDFGAMLRWFFWLGPRPRFERWTYWEKFDYWGEIGGLVLIGGSGLMLWAPMLFTRWLPGWVLNCAFVVHSIEALLAASVIFLVHFFNTHLRPEKFPVDLAMLTGQIRESQMREERADEYRRLAESGELEGLARAPAPRLWRFLGALAGIAAFLFGMALILLALKTELGQWLR